MNNPRGISVVICCYNCALRLPETIRHLAQQEVPAHLPWEIWIVNNASSDNTVQVAINEWQKYSSTGIEFNIVDEPTPGVLNARIKGINCARYEYLLFCDDDNWLNPSYVATAFEIMDANPEIGALGGCGEIVAEEPIAIDETLLSRLNANGPQHWAATDHWLYSAGMTIRKSIFMELAKHGWSLITTGRTGTNFLSGEDAEICFMFYLRGYQIAANNRLTFKHLIPVKRQSIKTIIDMAFWLSYSYYFLYGYIALINKEPVSLNDLSTRLLKSHSLSLLRSLQAVMMQVLKKGKRPTLEQRCTVLRHYGMVSSIIKNRKQVINHQQHIQQVLNSVKQGANA
ncbi:glycosyltransferase [Mucilaginibacter rubeus]|uniref:Glycosyltransferase family 2 protein n=1 Tax=Mucilaginibacter rubeus TaxID=2027860 RepID=A0A5C1I0C1_9SPHI|nr:glycosyltransferase [Mucilaginibacter rubeus]QEM11415.1 glycosyltransferase family 2 protein [Mucilaginibacter rubeus]